MSQKNRNYLFLTLILLNITPSFAVDPDLKKTKAAVSQISGNNPERRQSPSNRYLFMKDTLEFRMKYFSEELKYTNGTENSNSKLKANGAQEYRLTWYMTSGVRWQPLLTVAAKTVDYDLAKDSGINYKSNHLLGMGAGVRYRSSRRFIFTLLGEIEQYHFLEYADTLGVKSKQLIEASPTKVTFLTDILLFQKRRFLIKTDFGPVFNFNKKTANVSTNHGIGLTADLFLAYWFSSRTGVLLGGQYRMHKQEIKNGYFQADASRTTTGLLAQFNATF